MKRIIRTALAVSVLATSAGFISVSQAQELASQDFEVAVTLTTQCRTVAASDGQTLDFGTYTAFQATDATDSIAIAFECTRGLSPTTITLDTGADDAPIYGVIAGLNYSLSAAYTATTPGDAATAAASAIGTPDTITYTVSGNMPQGQAGAGAIPSVTPGNNTHTLTIAY